MSLKLAYRFTTLSKLFVIVSGSLSYLMLDSCKQIIIKMGSFKWNESTRTGSLQRAINPIFSLWAASTKIYSLKVTNTNCVKPTKSILAFHVNMPLGKTPNPKLPTNLHMHVSISESDWVLVLEKHCMHLLLVICPIPSSHWLKPVHPVTSLKCFLFLLTKLHWSSFFKSQHHL